MSTVINGIPRNTRRIMNNKLLLVILILLTACAESVPGNSDVINQQQSSSDIEKITPTFNSRPTQEREITQDIDPENFDYCLRPYTDDSIWNIPIDWETVEIHPESELMIAAFFKTRDWISSNTDSYAPNIYFVSDEIPLIPVKLRKNRFRDAVDDSMIIYGEPGGTVLMPIPEGAKPADGSDGQLAIINISTGEEWGLNKGEDTGQGQWYASGAYRYHINNSGIPAEGFGQRGAGIGQVAGIVRPCEVDRGFIGHAVTLAYDSPCKPDICAQSGKPEVVHPFTKTDGRGSLLNDIPEGARIVIRPEITWPEIVEACKGIKGCEVWVQNMQIYGGFIVDNSDHPKTYGEGSASANWDPDVWTKDMLRNIPTDWFAVLDF